MAKVNRTVTIALTTSFLPCFTAVSAHLEGLEQRSAQSNCTPIGRMLSTGNKNFPVKTFYCMGDHRKVDDGTRSKVFCFFNGQNFSLTDFASKCVQRETRLERSCNLRDRSKCPRTEKGPSNDNNLLLVRPYGNTLAHGRPFLSWQRVQEATSYKVKVKGEGVEWQEKEVVGTTLPYPADEPELEFGNTYTITLIAMRKNSAVRANSWPINMLSQADTREVTSTAKELNSLGLSKDEEAYLDLDRLYMSRGLIDETIATLEARIKAGSQNPKIYQTLGDRYLEAGLSDYAKSKYKMAVRLAQENNNLVELARAQASLRLIMH